MKLKDILLLHEGAVIGKHLKLLKKQGWKHDKSIDGGTMKTITGLSKKILKDDPRITPEKASSQWKILHDEDPGSWEMWTTNHPDHGAITLVAYKQDPFDDKKFGTLFVNFNNTWRGRVQSDKSLVRDVTNMLTNPAMLDNPTGDLDNALEYYRFLKI